MTLGPPPPWVCPNCGYRTCSTTRTGEVFCRTCTAKWPSQVKFESDCANSCVPARDSSSDYITSGDLQYDLDKLIEVATSKALIEFMENLEQEAREIFASGSPSRDYELYDLVVGRAQTVRRRIRRGE